MSSPTGFGLRIGFVLSWLSLVVFSAPGFVMADGIDDDTDGYCDDMVCTDGTLPGDCDDTNMFINPGEIDVPGNDVDENCDGTVACFDDFDDDTYGTTTSEEVLFYPASGGVSATPGACGSSTSDGYADNNTDCDDSNPAFNPGQSDIPGNDFDENCDGYISCFVDADNDTYGTTPGQEVPFYRATYGISDVTDACGSSSSDGYADNSDDCLDSDPTAFPGAPDTCGDGIDSDCDGIGGPLGDEDEDGCTWEQEDVAGSSDCDLDSDDDLFEDFDEMAGNCTFEPGETDPADPDSDNDLALDGEEVYSMGTDPLDGDSDDDGLADLIEDPNHNGIVDVGETHPMDADNDDDGLMEGEEDLDADGELDAGELDPRDADTDADYLNDGLESGRDYPVPAGVSDGWSLAYSGTDGFWQDDTDPMSTTDPLDSDTDNDRLLDGDEDANGDGERDADETDPNVWDTDQDTFWDGVEVVCGSNPLDPSSVPDCLVFFDFFESGTLGNWGTSVP